MTSHAIPYLELSRSQGGLVTLDIQHSPKSRQRALVGSAVTTIDSAREQDEVRAGAVLRGTGGRNVAVLTLPNSTSEIPDPLAHTVEIIDHIDDRDFSIIERGSPLFHFVNVFRIAPGKRDEMIRYFGHTIPFVRKQPGYVSTNLLVSLDGRQAVNVGQYERREDFLAIFRQREVLGAFARGFPRGIMQPLLGVLPRPPRLRLYELVHVAAEATTPSTPARSHS